MNTLFNENSKMKLIITDDYIKYHYKYYDNGIKYHESTTSNDKEGYEQMLYKTMVQDVPHMSSKLIYLNNNTREYLLDAICMVTGIDNSLSDKIIADKSFSNISIEKFITKSISSWNGILPVLCDYDTANKIFVNDGTMMVLKINSDNLGQDYLSLRIINHIESDKNRSFIESSVKTANYVLMNGDLKYPYKNGEEFIKDYIYRFGVNSSYGKIICFDNEDLFHKFIDLSLSLKMYNVNIYNKNHDVIKVDPGHHGQLDPHDKILLRGKDIDIGYIENDTLKWLSMSNQVHKEFLCNIDE